MKIKLKLCILEENCIQPVHLTERVFLDSGWFTDVPMLRPGQHRAVSATEGDSEAATAPVMPSPRTARVATLAVSLSQHHRLRAPLVTNLLQ